MLGKEVLEKHFIESWKKEASSEEDAARTISISLTVLGLSGVLLGLQPKAYKQIPIDFGLIVPMALLVLFLAFASMCILKILDAVRPVDYGHHPNEKKMLEFAEWEGWRLEVVEGNAGTALKDAVDASLTVHYLKAYAEMIAANRKLNAQRASARFEALTYSILTLVTSFASLVYVVVRSIGLHIPFGG